jgi:hypothetical protein
MAIYMDILSITTRITGGASRPVDAMVRRSRQFTKATTLDQGL